MSSPEVTKPLQQPAKTPSVSHLPVHTWNNRSLDEPLFTIPVQIQSGSVALTCTALVDSGASSCFLDSSFAYQHSLSLVTKDIPRHLQVIDGRDAASGLITQESAPIRLTTGRHQEIISLDVTSCPNYPIVLGLPWLRAHDPYILWSAGLVTFSSPLCLQACSRQSRYYSDYSNISCFQPCHFLVISSVCFPVTPNVRFTSCYLRLAI